MGVIIQSEWIDVNGAATITSLEEMGGMITVQCASPFMCTITAESSGIQIIGTFSVSVHTGRDQKGADISTVQTVDDDADFPISIDGYPAAYVNLKFVAITGVGKIRFTVTYG